MQKCHVVCGGTLKVTNFLQTDKARHTAKVDHLTQEELNETLQPTTEACQGLLRSLTMNIMLLGSTGAGKSSSGNTVIGGDGKIFTEKKSTEAVTRSCESGQTITVIDTVGLSDKEVENSNAQTEIQLILQSTDIDVFLLVIKLGQSFRQKEYEVVKWIHNHFGEKIFKHAIVLFTHGDQIHKPIEKYLSSSQALQSVVDQCSGRYHVFNNSNGDEAQVSELLQKIESLRKMNGNRRYTEEDYKSVQGCLVFLKCVVAGLAVVVAGAMAGAAGAVVVGTTGAAVGREIGEAAGELLEEFSVSVGGAMGTVGAIGGAAVGGAAGAAVGEVIGTTAAVKLLEKTNGSIGVTVGGVALASAAGVVLFEKIARWF